MPDEPNLQPLRSMTSPPGLDTAPRSARPASEMPTPPLRSATVGASGAAEDARGAARRRLRDRGRETAGVPQA